MGKDDLLLELAMRLEPDGGMPSRSDEERLAASLLALVFFAANGHSENQGAFRTHVQKLVGYLRNTSLVAHPALRVRDAVHDCVRRLEGLERLIQSFGSSRLQRKVAELCERSQQTVMQIADDVEREAGNIEALLTGFNRGNVPPHDHEGMVRDLLAGRHIPPDAIWQAIGATV